VHPGCLAIQEGSVETAELLHDQRIRRSPRIAFDDVPGFVESLSPDTWAPHRA